MDKFTFSALSDVKKTSYGAIKGVFVQVTEQFQEAKIRNNQEAYQVDMF